MLGLEQANRWQDLIAEIKGYTALAAELLERRPDVSDTIGKALSDFCTPSRLLALAELHDRDDKGRAVVEDLTRALGASLVPGFVALIDRAAHQVKARAFTPLMCELAPTVAEALLAELDSCGVAAARVIVKVLGYAGSGHEVDVARLVRHTDAQVAREALRALARLGTSTAAIHVARQLREGSEDRRAAAEEALWHFPPAPMATQLRELLRSREFVFKHPQLATRLIERAGQAKIQGLADVLKSLESLRFRFWKPSLVQVALKAREVRAK
jgi:HEAT repeat protein